MVNDKTLRMLSVVVGILVVWGCMYMYISGYPTQGFFADKIKYTTLYKFFDLFVKSNISYLCWTISFFVGAFASWKLRFIGGNILKRLIATV